MSTVLTVFKDYLTKSLWFPRSRLRKQCNGFDKAIITQENTPIGSELVFNGDGKTLQVTREIFRTFAKVCCSSFMDITTSRLLGVLLVPQILFYSDCSTAHHVSIMVAFQKGHSIVFLFFIKQRSYIALHVLRILGICNEKIF